MRLVSQCLQQDAGVRENVCQVQHDGLGQCCARVRARPSCSPFFELNDVERDRTLRREPALTQFETAQIANLCPADPEEAKSIIPRYVHRPPNYHPRV